MPITINMHKFSPPCRAVLMVAKELNIQLRIKNIDLTEGQHLSEEYIKINPAHTLPSIDDNGFILWESRAIMQYLCNNYAPDSLLYPKDPKQRALVDRWLNFDFTLYSIIKEALGRAMFGIRATDQSLKAFKDNFQLLEQLIGDNKYLVGNHKTIADLALLTSTCGALTFGLDLSDYPNFKRWITDVIKELPYFAEINIFDMEELMDYMKKKNEFVDKMKDTKQ